MQWSLIHKETNTFLQWQQWTPSTINLRGTFFCVFMKNKKGKQNWARSPLFVCVSRLKFFTDVS